MAGHRPQHARHRAGRSAEGGLLRTGAYPGLTEHQLTIAQVVQKALLEVDEEGTEAGAATGADAAGGAPPPTVATFDRPFLFLLTDTATRSLLFVAAVQNPSS